MANPAPTVAAEWLRRVEAEYSSAARTQEFVLWLIRIGASPDLIRAGLRIVEDELEHASLSHAVVVAAGSDAKPRMSQEQLGLARGSTELIQDVVHRTVEIFCIGETVAVPLFKAMRDECTAAAPKAALDRILVDEVRHRDFGWTTLGWLIEAYGEPIRVQVRRDLPALFTAVRRNYGEAGAGLDETSAALPKHDPAARAWGLMDAHRYAEILGRCFERDYVPRFSKLGIDPRPAWEASAPSPGVA